MLHEGTCAAARLAEVVRRYGSAHLSVRAVEPGEPGDWQLTFVAEPSVLGALRAWFEERKAPLVGSRKIVVPDRIASVFGGAGNVVALTGVVADARLKEFDLLQAGSPELWVERLVAALRGSVNSGTRTADAVAATGFHAGAAPRRRAVVLLLGESTEDSGIFPASGASAISKRSASRSKRGTWRRATGRTGPGRGGWRRRETSTTRCSRCGAGSRASPSPGWRPTSGPRPRRRARRIRPCFACRTLRPRSLPAEPRATTSRGARSRRFAARSGRRPPGRFSGVRADFGRRSRDAPLLCEPSRASRSPVFRPGRRGGRGRRARASRSRPPERTGAF